MNKKDLEFSKTLISWYDLNKRDLPWRQSKDPYKIWLSEVILQQTRVKQGWDYYIRFIETYPTVKDLAESDEDKVLKLWQGLGYYSRARNLHHTAKEIQSKYNGIFPKKHKEILALKGIGDYTAAAITSISYNMPYAAVDGNVYRVLSRIFGIDTPIDSTQGKKTFAELAQELLNEEDSGKHNQAMMELGAIQCTPVSPDCSICPFSNICIAYSTQTITNLPVKQGKIKTRKRFFNYLDIRYDETSLYLSKRGAGDIWQNLYELPLIETTNAITLEELIKTKEFENIFKGSHIKLITQKIGNIKHVLSHQQIHANFYRIDIDTRLNSDNNKLQLTPLDKLEEYAVSRLVDRYFEKEFTRDEDYI